MPKTILIVDDEIDIQSSLSFALKDEGYEVLTCSSPADALDLLQNQKFDVALFDVWFPVGDGIDLLKESREKFPHLIPIMMSGHGNIELAIKAIRLGAYDFLEKPLELDKVLVVLKNAFENISLKEENKRLSQQILQRSTLIGESPAVEKLRSELQKASFSDSPVVVLGENGVGKELCVRLLHQMSARRDAPYSVVNCAAFKGAQMDELLFGVRKTGSDFRGRLEESYGGTLMLDEVTALEPAMQAKLVQCLKDQSFYRVGGETRIPLRARLVAGAREDLEALSIKGDFSQDLYLRLGVVKILVPPLRRRIEDIEALSYHFLSTLAVDYGRPCPKIASKLLAWLRDYEWPGNVRELKNMLERMMIMNTEAMELSLSDLPEGIQDYVGAQELTSSSFEMLKDPGGSLRQLRAQFEKQILSARLNQLGGNVTKTAASLGLERAHLHRKLKQYEIHVQRGEDA